MRTTQLLIILIINSACSAGNETSTEENRQVIDVSTGRESTENESIDSRSEKEEGESSQDEQSMSLSVNVYGMPVSQSTENPVSVQSQGQSVVNQYCLSCHANFSSEYFRSQPSLVEELKLRIQLPQTNPSVMPPAEVSKRPSQKEKQDLLSWIDQGFPDQEDQGQVNEQEGSVRITSYDSKGEVLSELYFNRPNIDLNISGSYRFSIAIRDEVWKTVHTQQSQGRVDISLDGSPNRITPQSLNQVIDTYNISTVEEFIEQLPYEYKNNFVLMRESRSRHTATLKHPRIISYGYDASLMIGISTNPEDPEFEEVELAFLGEDGFWQFHLANFNTEKPQFADATASCGICHGTPARPIWADYPDWPGAYMDSVPQEIVLNDEEKQNLRLIRNDQSLNPRLAQFPYQIYGYSSDLNLDTGISEHDLVLITMRINFRHAESIFKRIQRDENYQKWRRMLLIDQACTVYYDAYSSANGLLAMGLYDELIPGGSLGQYAVTGKIIELMGMDSQVEMALNYTMQEDIPPNDPLFNHQGWFSGEGSLASVLAFLMLDELIHSDAEASNALSQTLKDKINELLFHYFQTLGKDRRPLLEIENRKEPYDYYYFSQLMDGIKAEATLCNLLESRQDYY